MRSHAFDPVVLVGGLIFLLGAGLWFGWDSGALSARSLTWLAPSSLIAVGLVLLVASTARRP